MRKVCFILVSCSLMLQACQKAIPVTAISLNPTAVEIIEGESYYISATVFPENATNKALLWSSDNSSVMVQDGIVFGVRPGTATVSATTIDGGKTAICNVKVIARAISVTGVSLNKTTIEVNVGETATLDATVSPNEATNKTVNWSSSDESIATVSNTGLVTGVAGGSAVITATTVDGGKKATCTVRVISVPIANDLGLSVKWASFNLGATKPEEYGNYYSWGEVTSCQGLPDWEDYKWSTYSYSSLTKYNNSNRYGIVDNKTILDPEDDAAHVVLGGNWRMPTDSEFRELIDNCSSEWITLNGVNGLRFTSKKSGYTDKSVFFPATGYRTGKWYQGNEGCYWSSSLTLSVAYDAEMFHIYSNNTKKIYGSLRCDAESIRPVCP